MAGFVYYIPEKTRSIGIEDVIQAGLGHAFGPRDGTSVTAVEVARGPDDGPAGIVIGDPGCVEPSLIGYYPDRQEWLKVPGTEAFVGWRPEQPPGPGDLARPNTLDGHDVRLGDGNRWLIPVARGLVEQDGELRYVISVPTSTSIDENGNWTSGSVVGRYKPLWDLACRWWDAVGRSLVEDDHDDSQTVRFNFDGLNDAALDVLATNYRVGKAEVAALGLFDSRCVYEVMNAVVDMPAIMAFFKKKASGLAAGV